MIKLAVLLAVAVGCIAVRIDPKLSENEKKSIEDDLTSAEIVEPDNFLLPEEQEAAVEETGVHKREKKSPWAGNQMYGYPVQSDAVALPQSVPRNFYQYDEPAELERSRRRYRTTDESEEYRLMQRLATLRKQIEQEQQMYASHLRRLRQADPSSDQQVGGALGDFYSMFDSILGSPQAATPTAGSADPQTSMQRNYQPAPYSPSTPSVYPSPPTYPSSAQPSYSPLQPPYSAPAHSSYSPPTQPSYPAPAHSSYSPPTQPSYPAPAHPSYSPPAQPSYSAPVQPTHSPHVSPVAHQPQQSYSYQPSPCAKNLLIGCQPQVQHVPCSASFEAHAQPYPIQPSPVHPPAIYPGLTSSHETTEAAAPKAETIPTTKPTEPATISARSHEPESSDVKPAKPVIEKPSAASKDESKKPKVEVDADVPKPIKEVKVTEVKHSDHAVDEKPDKKDDLEKARDSFIELLNAKKRAQETESPAKIVPVNSPGASSINERIARSQYLNDLW